MKITYFELAEKVIENLFMTPIFVIGVIVSLVFWGLIFLIIWPFSQLTFSLHAAEKRYIKKKDDEFDEELDRLIEKLQEESMESQ